MYTVMKKLITKRFYAAKEEPLDICSTFFAVKQLNSMEYADLVTLIDEYYPEVESTDKMSSL